MAEDKSYIFQFEIPDFREITETGQRMILEFQVKSNGIWRIHKNDSDDVFPSDLHADRVDGPEKLDIYTGLVYDKRTQKQISKMPKKAMRYIHAELINCKEAEIKTKLADSSRFTYLN